MPFLATTNATPYYRQTRKLLEAEWEAAAQARRERIFTIQVRIGLPAVVLVGSFIYAVIITL